MSIWILYHHEDHFSRYDPVSPAQKRANGSGKNPLALTIGGIAYRVVRTLSRDAVKPKRAGIHAPSRRSGNHSHPTGFNGFRLGSMARPVRGSFDYLMYPQYPAYHPSCYHSVISADNNGRCWLPINTCLLYLLERCSSRFMCLLSFRKAIHLLLDSAQKGGIFPFLYCPADWIRQNSGRNANHPNIFPADKKSNQHDGCQDNRPVYELESPLRFIQLSDNIESVRGMRRVLDKLRCPRGSCAGTKIRTARFSGFSISGVAQDSMYRRPDAAD